MQTERKQSFLHGAAILTAAGIIVKIIGAFYKIPLGAILGPVGTANFSIAYSIYALLFVISTAGLPSAVSKMISEACSRGDYARSERIYKSALGAFSLIGAAGFVIMFVFAEQIGNFMGSKDSAAAIRAISPAVMLVSVSSISRGYFQGRLNMYPTAVSEIIEALGKLVFGISAAWYMKKSGFGDSAVSAGAVLGVSIGALMSAVYFLFLRDRRKRAYTREKSGSMRILKELLSLAVPISAGAAVISLTNVIDSALVMNLLKHIGFSENETKWLFGAYNYSLNLFNLPSAVVTCVGTTLIPAVSGAFAKKEYRLLDSTVNSALKTGMIFSFAAAGGMCALSNGILSLLYGNFVEEQCINTSALLLSILTAAIPFLSFSTLTNSVHQSLGRVFVPVASILVGGAVKLLSNIILISCADINIYGTAISTVLSYLAIAVSNSLQLRKYDFLDIDYEQVFIKPLIVGGVTFCASFVSVKQLSQYFGNGAAVFISVAVGLLACAVTCFCVRAVSKKEFMLLFRGGKVFKF